MVSLLAQWWLLRLRYGDITVVLRPSVANAVSIVSAFDTGPSTHGSSTWHPMRF